jgi:hypothetical protein
VTKYRITVVKYEDDEVTPAETVTIDLNTPYTLANDMAEWVTEEVDSTAIINRTVHDEEWTDDDDE